MTRPKVLLLVLTLLMAAAPMVGLLLARSPSSPAGSADSAPQLPIGPEIAPEELAGSDPYLAPEADSVYSAAVDAALAYLGSQYHPATGLVNSVVGYPYATVWDIGSTLAAYVAAHELGRMDRAELDERLRRSLATLGRVPLFAALALNKNYQIAIGAPAGRSDREPDVGHGVSAIDLGRLLIWLKFIESRYPEHAEAARAIVHRMGLSNLVRDGYLWGVSVDEAGRSREHQEGRLGYEQYAAAGFAAWGFDAARARDPLANAETVEVLGVPILADRRSGGFLTSEPFYLLALELGFPEEWNGLLDRLLLAQRRRWEETDQVTIVSEDAIPLPPDYFYYYTLIDDAGPFAVRSLGRPGALEGPRWVSAKGAFAWYALRPTRYTWMAVEHVLPARGARGWESGVFEGSGETTGSENINTAAVILTAALYRERDAPVAAPGGAASEQTSN